MTTSEANRRTRRHGSRLALTLIMTAAAAQAEAQSADSWQNVRGLFETYCFDCHGDGADKGNLTLDHFTSEAAIKKEVEVWDTIKYQVENWVMPPSDRQKQPTEAERKRMASFIDELLYPCDCDHPDPGRVTIRRLNRQEYNNTVRDLVGLDLKPADSFPPDDTGYGFDNIGDVLTLPPILMERYLMAADSVLDQAIVTGPPAATKRRYKASVLTGGERQGSRARVLEKNGDIATRHRFDHEGEYRIRVSAYGDQAGDEPIRMAFRIGDKTVQEMEMPASKTRPEEFEVMATAEKGYQQVSVRFLNDFQENGTRRDRNLYIEFIEIEGPFQPKAEALPESHRNIFIVPSDTPGAAERIIRHFANRAFRRPVKADEVDRLKQFVDLAKTRGDSFEMGIKQALRAVMVSPHFLYRIEWQPEPNNPDKVHDISEFALASRLSYFLWSSMPDNELLSLAFRGELRNNLQAQVLRMLKDPKARELARNFAGQWLETRNLQIQEPDPERFPDFDEALRQAMERETEEFFYYIMRENRSVLEFLYADYTFANERLAKHYGIQGVQGDAFRKVSLENTPRRGVLTHASVLTVTSDPIRTSPVKRGKWILDNFFGTPPPPPPPNVPELDDNAAALASGSLRERMEQHRNTPGCASCHNLMDPLGFGLEHFDGIGAFRNEDEGHAIDASGQLTSGQKFRGNEELIDILLDEKRDLFLKCLVEKMLTFGLGRGLEYYDKCAVEEILTKLKTGDHRFQELILAVGESVPFQKRRGDDAAASAPLNGEQAR